MDKRDCDRCGSELRLYRTSESPSALEGRPVVRPRGAGYDHWCDACLRDLEVWNARSELPVPVWPRKGEAEPAVNFGWAADAENRLVALEGRSDRHVLRYERVLARLLALEEKEDS